MLCNSIWWHGGTAEQGIAVRFDGSSVVLLWWIVLYFVDMWNVKKESCWKQGNLFQTVAQSKIQYKFHSQTQEGSQTLCFTTVRYKLRHVWFRIYEFTKAGDCESGADCISERTALSSGLHYRANCITERTALSTGLHYRATSAERFCILKIIYKENSEIFCWADPINRVWWL